MGKSFPPARMQPPITAVLVGVVIIMVAIATVAAITPAAYAEVKQTDGGTLDVRLVTDPEVIEAGEEVRLHIDFINPVTDEIQIHIDYVVTVLEDGSDVFGPTNRIHTSEGRGSIPIQFQRDGEYEVKIDVDGILFNPIPAESVMFALTVDGDGASGGGDKMPDQKPPDPVTDGGNGNGDGSNGCLIATAAFGTEMADEVQMLREIRDHSLLATQSGTAFMAGFNQIYYLFSPTVADWERQNPAFREAVRIALTPLLASLSLLNHEGVTIDSEGGVLGYGIGIIALNVGMYAGLPVAGLWWMRRSRGAGRIGSFSG